MLKAIVIVIALVASTSTHAQPTSAWSQPGAYQAPQSAWNDHYQPPKSQWSSPKAYRAPKSGWNNDYQPPKSQWSSPELSSTQERLETGSLRREQAPDSWWSDPGHQNPPKSSWTDR